MTLSGRKPHHVHLYPTPKEQIIKEDPEMKAAHEAAFEKWKSLSDDERDSKRREYTLFTRWAMAEQPRYRAAYRAAEEKVPAEIQKRAKEHEESMARLNHYHEAREKKWREVNHPQMVELARKCLKIGEVVGYEDDLQVRIIDVDFNSLEIEVQAEVVSNRKWEHVFKVGQMTEWKNVLHDEVWHGYPEARGADSLMSLSVFRDKPCVCFERDS